MLIQHLGKLHTNSLQRGLTRMNTRVIFGAILGLGLYIAVFWLAPKNFFGTWQFQLSFGLLVYVTAVSASLIRFGHLIFKSKWGALGWRLVFGVHSTIYSLTWGCGCAFLLNELGITTYSISITTTALAACTVAVSTFAFDLVACLIFLLTLLCPLLYSSLFTLKDGEGLAGACTLSILFFMYLARSIHVAEIGVLLHEDTIRDQATKLKESNEALTASNNLVRDTLDSIDEAFLVLSLDGICFGNPSKKAHEFLNMDPRGQHFSAILRLDEQRRDEAEDWFRLITSERLEFKSLSHKGPNEWHDSSRGLTYRVRYFPMRVDGKLTAVIMTLADVSAKLRTERLAEDAEHRARMILSVSEARHAFAKFVSQTTELFLELEARKLIDFRKLRQELHTAKGTAAVFHIRGLAQEIDHLERDLKKFAPGDPTLPELLQSKSQEILKNFRHWLAKETKTFQRLRVFAPEEITLSANHMDMVLRAYSPETRDRDLAVEIVTRLKAQNLGMLLASYEAHIQTLSRKLAKIARFEVSSNTESCFLVGDAYPLVVKAMVHLFNNAVDHGLERPDERASKGKPEYGMIRASFQRMGDELHIQIEDDGAGIDPLRIRKVAQERGISTQNLLDHDVIRLVFDAGFTTKKDANELSGQGIGLNSLYEQVVKCGGSIAIASKFGSGTSFLIKLPANPNETWFFTEPLTPIQGSTRQQKAA